MNHFFILFIYLKIINNVIIRRSEENNPLQLELTADQQQSDASQKDTGKAIVVNHAIDLVSVGKAKGQEQIQFIQQPTSKASNKAKIEHHHHVYGQPRTNLKAKIFKNTKKPNKNQHIAKTQDVPPNYPPPSPPGDSQLPDNSLPSEQDPDVPGTNPPDEQLPDEPYPPDETMPPDEPYPPDETNPPEEPYPPDETNPPEEPPYPPDETSPSPIYPPNPGPPSPSQPPPSMPPYPPSNPGYPSYPNQPFPPGGQGYPGQMQPGYSGQPIMPGGGGGMYPGQMPPGYIPGQMYPPGVIYPPGSNYLPGQIIPGMSTIVTPYPTTTTLPGAQPTPTPPVVDNCPAEVESVGCYLFGPDAKTSFNTLLATKAPGQSLEQLFCQCGAAAQQKGWMTFVISDSKCYSGQNEGSYNSGGLSQQCFNEAGQPCTDSDIYCSGDPTSINVYSIITQTHRNIVTGKGKRH